MIDDQKQPDSTSQQTDEPLAEGQQKLGGESEAAEVDVSVETDSETQANIDEKIAEATATGAANVAGEGEGGVTAQTATEAAPREGDVADRESLQQENEALKARLEELNQQYESLKTQSMRMAADFDNFRKRTAKEKEDLEQQVKGTTITELLPVVDNFERARSQIKPQNDGEMAIHKSYQGVYKQLVDGLKRLGVSPMRPEGQEFDPNIHEAVMREATDEYPEGVVIEQLMRGYFLGERVLRHAMVKVAAATEAVVTSEEDTQES